MEEEGAPAAPKGGSRLERVLLARRFAVTAEIAPPAPPAPAPPLGFPRDRAAPHGPWGRVQRDGQPAGPRAHGELGGRRPPPAGGPGARDAARDAGPEPDRPPGGRPRGRGPWRAERCGPERGRPCGGERAGRDGGVRPGDGG